MRVIDFLQLILDLDKQTRFFYQDKAKELIAVTEIKPTDSAVVLTTKKASTHALHQWELVTLLQTIQDKTIFMRISAENEALPFYGIQLHDNVAYVK